MTKLLTLLELMALHLAGLHQYGVRKKIVYPTSKTKLITLVLTICAGVVFAYLIKS